MMWQQETWSEWMWLAMGVAMIVVVSLATWAIVATLRMMARRPGDHAGPDQMKRSVVADKPDGNEPQNRA